MKKIICFSLIIATLIIPIISLKIIEKKQNILLGTIIEKNNEYFSIITNKDLILKFKYKIKYDINTNIEIKYNRNINSLKYLQNINIESINKINKIIYEKNDIFYKQYNKAEKLINSMTLDEKIGQLLLSRNPENTKGAINKYNLGGLILFNRDIKNKTKLELINNINEYQSLSKMPLLIAIDEEGGTVTRLSNNKNIVAEKFLSPKELYNKGGFKLIKEDTINKTNILKSLGININLAPVADYSTDVNSFIYNRTIGQNINKTSKYIDTIISNSNKDVSFVLKHFPGYGNNIDTHDNISIDYSSYKDLKYNNFKPFKSGVKNNVQAIMMSHIIESKIDDNPTSLSINLHNILRNDLKYNGIILTDDLEMKAIKNNINKPYAKAIKAGNNLIIVSDYEIAFNEIKESINNNEISEALIDKLLIKTISWKYYKNLL